MKLFRPIGLKELELIGDSGSKKFPPRLDWQPIFYPVLNFEYAAQIAKDWNTVDEFSGFVGFVTEFEVADSFVSKYEPQNVGGKIHNELWIPAEDLAQMNDNIQGEIQVIAAFYGKKYEGQIQSTELFAGKNVKEQAALIKQDKKAFLDVISRERNALLANYPYWELNGLLSSEILTEIQKRRKEETK